MSSSHSQFHGPSPSTANQDESLARRKLEQKRRFQQKQGNMCKDVDSLMQTMFSDLKLQPKATTQNIEGKDKNFEFRSFQFIFLGFSINEMCLTNIRY